MWLGPILDFQKMGANIWLGPIKDFMQDVEELPRELPGEELGELPGELLDVLPGELPDFFYA